MTDALQLVSSYAAPLLLGYLASFGVVQGYRAMREMAQAATD